MQILRSRYFLTFSILSVSLVFAVTIFGQHGDQDISENDKLYPIDETEKWEYPYEATEEKRRKLLQILSDFKDPIPVKDLIRKLGNPDRIDDLSAKYKPLSPYEAGFLAGSKVAFMYRCIWFARKYSKSPGIGDSWLAAYVDKNERTVSVIHQNWLKK
jgi:hypothetical protein